MGQPGLRLAFWLAFAAFALRLSPGEQAALDTISAASLKTSVAYLASDELQGRLTPSPGLEKAADFIAARLREGGLEPVFQRAPFLDVDPVLDGFEMRLKAGGKEHVVTAERVGSRAAVRLDFKDAPVVELPGNGVIPAIAGRVVAGNAGRYASDVMLGELQARHPSLILLFGKTEAGQAAGSFLYDVEAHGAPVLYLHDSESAGMLRGERAVTVSLHLAKPLVKEVELRNVAAVLRGSDPVLRDQYVLVSAHYDHIGRTTNGIFHGANDDASGTASVIEIGLALARLKPRPKRSVVLLAFFGEEEGLLGSTYYARNPLAPLKSTVADINLEHMGRTDEASGKEMGAFAISGPSYSNVGALMAEAARAQGVRMYAKAGADEFFDRSDNYSLALHGVIAHTIGVAFEFPDYHGLGDTWEKLDFANMAKVDRGVAAGILRLANEVEVPHWSRAPGAGIYRSAGQ